MLSIEHWSLEEIKYGRLVPASARKFVVQLFSSQSHSRWGEWKAWDVGGRGGGGGGDVVKGSSGLTIKSQIKMTPLINNILFENFSDDM